MPFALAAALLLASRLRRTGPRYLASREKDERVKAMIWYRAILRLLARSGLTPEGGETPEMFASRVSATEGVPAELTEMANRIAEMQYSRREPNGEAAALGETIYEELLRGMSRGQRLSWHIDRMLHGIGDYSQIP